MAISPFASQISTVRSWAKLFAKFGWTSIGWSNKFSGRKYNRVYGIDRYVISIVHIYLEVLSNSSISICVFFLVCTGDKMMISFIPSLFFFFPFWLSFLHCVFRSSILFLLPRFLSLFLSLSILLSCAFSLFLSLFHPCSLPIRAKSELAVVHAQNNKNSINKSYTVFNVMKFYDVNLTVLHAYP